MLVNSGEGYASKQRPPWLSLVGPCTRLPFEVISLLSSLARHGHIALKVTCTCRLQIRM